MADKTINTSAIYGYCPTCNKPGVERMRNPRGPLYCEDGHAYIFKHWNQDRLQLSEQEANAKVAVPDENLIHKGRSAS